MQIPQSFQMWLIYLNILMLYILLLDLFTCFLSIKTNITPHEVKQDLGSVAWSSGSSPVVANRS